MQWGHPPTIKIYEALGAMADGRVEVDGDTAKVYSSSGNKFYMVTYDAAERAIMANDNGSYWKGYLGYPSIAYLLETGGLEYKPQLAKLLKGVAWKDINQKYKNDFEKTLAEILSLFSDEEVAALHKYVTELDEEIAKLDLQMLGKRTLPPKGY